VSNRRMGSKVPCAICRKVPTVSYKGDKAYCWNHSSLSDYSPPPGLKPKLRTQSLFVRAWFHFFNFVVIALFSCVSMMLYNYFDEAFLVAWICGGIAVLICVALLYRRD